MTEKRFGAAKQLVRALILMVVTFYLLERGRPIWYTLYPMLFMIITPMAALSFQGWQFLRQGKFILAFLAVLLLALALCMLREGWNRSRQAKTA